MAPGHSVEGNANTEGVRYSNKMLRRVIWLAHMQILRGVKVILENPSNSFMFGFPMLQALMNHHGLHMCQVDMCNTLLFMIWLCDVPNTLNRCALAYVMRLCVSSLLV